MTIGIFGDNEFFSKFGKHGTENDILIRNQSDSGNILTYVAPNSDKIQPLIQTAAMIDFPVIIVNEMNSIIGEIFILLNEMNFSQGLIVTDFLEDNIRTMIKDMSISSFDFVKKDEAMLREKIMKLYPAKPGSPLLIPIDNYFSVKGVGTVILGIVKSGQARQYDKLFVYPPAKEILIKSMQSQDRDVKETESGQRIGLAVKGIETDELKRGFILSDKEIKCSKNLSLEFTKTKYSKYQLAEGKRIMIGIGLQILSGEIKNISNNKMEIQLDASIAIYQNNCLLATSDSSPRIIGSGKILL